MHKPRILIVSYLAHPLFAESSGVVHGGSELAMYNLAKYTNKDEFEVHCLVGDFSQPANQLIDQIHVHKGPKVERVGILKGMLNVLNLFRKVKQINPDVMVSSSAGWLTIELILIKILLGKRYIFRSSHRRNIDGSLDSKGYGWLYRRLMNRIDCFVIQNAEDELVLRTTYSYVGKVVCIKNLQDIPPKIDDSYRQREYILWVGRSEAIKQPELFLELARKLPKHQFKMLMPKTNEAIYAKITEEAKLIPNLTILDWIDHEAIAQLYQSARFLVSTSAGEGLPNVVLEAMKYGCPILSYQLDYDGMIENSCGLVAGGDMIKLVEFIDSCQEQTWQKLSDACFDYATANFSAPKNIKAYEAILRG